MMGDDVVLRLGSSTTIVAVIVNRKDRKMGKKGIMKVNPYKTKD
jgi:aspartate carbamoyltransferase regulatory subunit